MKNRKAKKGFTIIELVIVIAVIGILAGVLIPTFSNVIANANKTAAMEEAKNAYTIFLADHAEDIDLKNSNFYIKSGDYFFKVTAGQFDATALEGITESAIEVKDGAFDSTTYKITDGVVSAAEKAEN